MRFNSASTLRRIGTMLVGSTLAAGLLTGPMGGVAHAYGESDCGRPEKTFRDVDYTRLDGGSVDYGDGWHFSGEPTDNAITCWGENRNFVLVRGWLYWDSWSRGCAGIEVTIYSRSGSKLQTHKDDLCGKTDSAQPDSIPIYQAYSAPSGTQVDKVRIRLYKAEVGDFSSSNLVATAWDAYGD